MARKNRVPFTNPIPDSPARRFVDSAEESYQRLRKQHNGTYHPRPYPIGETPQAVQPPDKDCSGSASPIAAADTSARTEAIAAAAVLGIRKAQAEHWASLAPLNSTSGQIVSFILRSRQ